MNTIPRFESETIVAEETAREIPERDVLGGEVCPDHRIADRLRDVRWFGVNGYEISEPIELGYFPLKDHQVWVSVEATRYESEGAQAIGITARYKIFRDGVLVPFSDQRGISPVFSIDQILEAASNWLARYEGGQS